MPKETLTNAEIWNANFVLGILSNQKFPVMVSYRLAKLLHKVRDAAKPLEDTRNALIVKHGKKNEITGKEEITQTITEMIGDKEVVKANPALASFNEEWERLMKEEQEFDFEKVKIPERVASTCDKCHHNMDRALEIEPALLLALDKFIEIA